jgi:hypothetical protein
MPLDIEQTLLELVEKQSATHEAIETMNERLFGGDGQTGALPFIHQEHKELEKRVGAVENKIWYGTGFAAAIGAALTYLGFHIPKH